MAIAESRRNRTIHLSALMLTKIADGILDPKLVLAWLMNAIGAPGYLIGLLVPTREAGALLPQLLLARRIEQSELRKGFWVAGSAIQGAAALGIALAAVWLTGAMAGWVVLGCLAMLAIARSVCSVSYKDILARTVQKGERGKISGAAGTAAASAVFGFGILLSVGVLPLDPLVISSAIGVAGLLWLIGAGVFSSLNEPADEPASYSDRSLGSLLRPLQDDAEFQTYVSARVLLISTALAPPFLVILGNLEQAGLGNLGVLVIASSIAAIVSSYIWGGFADRSSRRTLMASGSISAVTLFCASIAGLLGMQGNAGWLIPGFIFMAQIAYNGARAGRKTHLTDMDTQGRKPVYTALSNTVIGTMLLVGGLLGIVSDYFGPQAVLAILSGLSAAAVLAAHRLSEVQAQDE